MAQSILTRFRFRTPNLDVHRLGCRVDYRIEVLKDGAIVDERALGGKDHFTVGRLPTCDFPMEHPSLSRLHAVLQFRGSDGAAYVYDCNSAHGTFVNKRRIKAGVHVPIRYAPPLMSF